MKRKHYVTIAMLFLGNIVFSQNYWNNIGENLLENNYYSIGNNSFNSEIKGFPQNKLLITIPMTFTTSQDIGTKLLLTWTPIAGASNYILRYRIPGGNWTGVGVNTNQCGVGGLLPNTFYECFVYIYSGGTTSVSTLGGFTTTDVFYSKAFDMGTTTEISWSLSTPWASSYVIHYRESGNLSWTGLGFSTFPVTLSNLKENTTYDCRIGVYINGFWWEFSKIWTFQTGNIDYMTSQDMGTTLLLSWTNMSWASNYQIQYKKIGTTSMSWTASPTNQAKISSLIPDSDYECKVFVFKNNAFYGASVIDTFHTSKVYFNTLTDNVTSMQIGWTSLSPWATSYVLQYRLPLSANWVNSPNAAVNNVMISPVAEGQDYFIKLRVYINNVLWGTSQEQKMGRNHPFAKSVSDTEIVSESNISVSNPFPNPCNERTNLSIYSVVSSDCFWEMFDITGKKVISGNEKMKEGNNSLIIKTYEFPKGYYLLNVVVNDLKQSFKILKN